MANVSSSNGLEKRPKLRFPGFDEPWQSTLLSSVFAKNTKKNTDGQITNVICNSAKQGLIPQREYFDKDIANSDNTSGYYIIEENDFVYNPRKSADAPYGPISSYKYAEAGIVSPLYLCFRAKKEINPAFFEWYFRSSAWHRYVYLSGDSGARHDRVSIKDDTFFAMPINLPAAQEQEHIASFLERIDQKIEMQRALVENLKKYKRGLLREIFAKLSESCENRKLKDVSVLFADGDWIESKDQAPDGIRLIQTGNVGFGMYLDKPQNAKYISDDTFHRLNCLEIYAGDILISRLPEPAGRACLLPKSTERRITAVDCTVIRTDASVIDRNYLLQFLCSEQYLKTVNSFLAGGTRQRISRKNLEGIEVPYPSIDKQEYYGDFLCKVDTLVFNEEQRLSYITRLRCFMLQRLFI